MLKRYLLILLFTVFVPSLLMRLYPIVSESFAHDAIVSQMAAKEGVYANAWDKGDAFQLRRYHPPLLSHIITANNAFLGSDEFRARLYSTLTGALSCLVAAISI